MEYKGLEIPSINYDPLELKVKKKFKLGLILDQLDNEVIAKDLLVKLNCRSLEDYEVMAELIDYMKLKYNVIVNSAFIINLINKIHREV